MKGTLIMNKEKEITISEAQFKDKASDTVAKLIAEIASKGQNSPVADMALMLFGSVIIGELANQLFENTENTHNVDK